MYAIRTYIFYQSLNRLQLGLSAIAELLVDFLKKEQLLHNYFRTTIIK